MSQPKDFTEEGLSLFVKKIIAETLSQLATPTQEILDVPQAAELLRVKTSTIYSYVFHRKIPYLKREGKLLFNRSELLEWIQSGRRAAIEEVAQSVNPFGS